jgi:hypothetical protein
MTLSLPLRNRALFFNQTGLNLDRDTSIFYSGIDGDPNPHQVPKISRYAKGENHIEGSYGSGIRIGVDRMNEKTDPSTGESYTYGAGYGGVGAFGCSAVDIYAGLDSHGTAEGKVFDEPVNPNSKKDAARVYVSAKCDVDDMFAVPDGNIGNVLGKSAAVVKADHVRIIGRESIKICSGISLKNSFGKPINSPGRINLIAGAVDELSKKKLQPIPKGNNVLAALNDIVDNINELATTVDNFLMFQHKYNTVLMSHKHPSPTSMAIGTLATGNPTSLAGGETLISFDCMTAGFDATTSALSCKKTLMLHGMRTSGIKIQRLEQFSSDYINSGQVYTT